MEDRCEHKSLTEGGLEITGYEGMEMGRDVAELEVGAPLEIFGETGRWSSELGTESDTALVVKTVTCLYEDGVGAFEVFNITGIDAGDDFVGGVGEDFLSVRRVAVYRFAVYRFAVYINKGQEIADFVVFERGNEAKFVEGLERMFMCEQQDVVYLLGGEKIELGEFFIGSVVEVNGGIVEGVEVSLELFEIDFAELGEVGIDI
jgi:hypothetical protein